MKAKLTTLPLGLLSISGPDAKKFLQGQLTCDLEDVTLQESRLGAHCNPQGRIISFFRIVFFEDQYFLSMPSELVPIAMKTLQKYAVFFKVKLTDVSNDYYQWGYIGPEMPANKADIIIKVPDGNRFHIITKNPEFSANFELFPATEWKHLDMQALIPTIYPETSGLFLPHDLNLPALNAVSFKKGCFTGQEIIARMQYLGKLKKKLVYQQLTLPEVPQRGTDIQIENQAATIVDFCQLGYNTFDLLIVIARSALCDEAISQRLLRP